LKTSLQGLLHWNFFSLQSRERAMLSPREAAARKPRNSSSTVARLGAEEEESRAEVAILGG
jgi:hypothetical protein